MDYQKHYNTLIERARNRVLMGYFETHHVVPKCLSGTDNASNLVDLTAEEHYVAHQLLIKIHPDSTKLAYAALLMSTAAHAGRTQNKLYGWLKRRIAVSKSVDFSGKIWTEKQNSNRSETVKAQWADPEFRAARSAVIREGLKSRRPISPDKKAELSAAQSERTKARWQNPEYRAAQAAKNRARRMTEDQRAAVSERMKGRVHSDSAREKMRASRLSYLETNC